MVVMGFRLVVAMGLKLKVVLTSFYMLNIAKLKNSKSKKSYTLPLKARVVGTMHYQVDGGEKKE